MSVPRYILTLAAYLLLALFLITGAKGLAAFANVILGLLIGWDLFSFCRWASRKFGGQP